MPIPTSSSSSSSSSSFLHYRQFIPSRAFANSFSSLSSWTPSRGLIQAHFIQEVNLTSSSSSSSSFDPHKTTCHSKVNSNHSPKNQDASDLISRSSFSRKRKKSSQVYLSKQNLASYQIVPYQGSILVKFIVRWNDLPNDLALNSLQFQQLMHQIQMYLQHSISQFLNLGVSSIQEVQVEQPFILEHDDIQDKEDPFFKSQEDELNSFDLLLKRKHEDSTFNSNFNFSSSCSLMKKKKRRKSKCKAVCHSIYTYSFQFHFNSSMHFSPTLLFTSTTSSQKDYPLISLHTLVFTLTLQFHSLTFTNPLSQLIDSISFEPTWNQLFQTLSHQCILLFPSLFSTTYVQHLKKSAHYVPSILTSLHRIVQRSSTLSLSSSSSKSTLLPTSFQWKEYELELYTYLRQQKKKKNAIHVHSLVRSPFNGIDSKSNLSTTSTFPSILEKELEEEEEDVFESITFQDLFTTHFFHSSNLSSSYNDTMVPMSIELSDSSPFSSSTPSSSVMDLTPLETTTTTTTTDFVDLFSFNPTSTVHIPSSSFSSSPLPQHENEQEMTFNQLQRSISPSNLTSFKFDMKTIDALIHRVNQTSEYRQSILDGV